MLIWINPNPKMSIVVPFLCVSRVVTFMVTSELLMSCLLFYIPCCSLLFGRNEYLSTHWVLIRRFAMIQISMIRLLSLISIKWLNSRKTSIISRYPNWKAIFENYVLYRLIMWNSMVSLQAFQLVGLNAAWKHSKTNGRPKGGRPPPAAQNFSISCRFLENLVKLYVGVPQGRCPLLRRILDPPLKT